jgi:SAM-dependent methyltransferase
VSLKTISRWARDLVDLEKSSLDAALTQAAGLASGRLLDVGCGDKPYEALFAPRVSSYVGVEYESTYRDSANAKLNRADHVYDGQTLPFADESFDTVLNTQVLEHVPDPFALFQEMVRVLAPGGRLLLTVPFAYRIHSVPYDFHRFTHFALESLAARHGLEVERLSSRGGFWIVMGQKFTSHLALNSARLGRTVQEAGGLTYEKPESSVPRWWVLPVVAPLIVSASLLARALDRLDHDESDTLGYLLVARKPRRQHLDAPAISTT